MMSLTTSPTHFCIQWTVDDLYNTLALTKIVEPRKALADYVIGEKVSAPCRGWKGQFEGEIRFIGSKAACDDWLKAKPEDFEETYSLVEEYKFPSLFINQYSPRPGTPAAKMHRTCTTQEVKKRTKKLSELFHSYHPYEHKLGEQQRILVTEVSHDKQHYVGHNKFYEQVLVPKKEALLGRMVDVRIAKTGEHYLMGEVLCEDKAMRPQVPPPLSQGAVSGVVTPPNMPQNKESLKSHYILWLSVLVVVVAVIIRLWNLLPCLPRIPGLPDH